MFPTSYRVKEVTNVNEESESKVPVVESDSESKAIPEAPPITELGPEKPEKSASSVEASSPPESQDRNAVLILLGLGALGGLVLLSRQKTGQQT